MSNLALIVINDGDGTQCGKSYKERCVLAKNLTQHRFEMHCLAMVVAADNWNIDHGGEPALGSDLVAAAADVAEYYVRHVKEIGAVKLYTLRRFYFDGDSKVIKTGVTLAEAMTHCMNPESRSKTAVSETSRADTRKHGTWFDGYEAQSLTDKLSAA